MYLYTNEKVQKTAFLPLDMQKRRIREDENITYLVCNLKSVFSVRYISSL